AFFFAIGASPPFVCDRRCGYFLFPFFIAFFFLPPFFAALRFAMLGSPPSLPVSTPSLRAVGGRLAPARDARSDRGRRTTGAGTRPEAPPWSSARRTRRRRTARGDSRCPTARGAPGAGVATP